MLFAEDFAVDDGGDTHPSRRLRPRRADIGRTSPFGRLRASKEFFDARQTAGDVTAGLRHTAGVERTERGLRTGFTDGLRGDDADGRPDFDHFAATEVTSPFARRYRE